MPYIRLLDHSCNSVCFAVISIGKLDLVPFINSPEHLMLAHFPQRLVQIDVITALYVPALYHADTHNVQSQDQIFFSSGIDQSKLLFAPRYRLKHGANVSQWITFLPLITTSVVDILIAVSLCYTLASLRTGFTEWVLFVAKRLVAELQIFQDGLYDQVSDDVYCQHWSPDEVIMQRFHPHPSSKTDANF
jgi:hypothetical protein